MSENCTPTSTNFPLLSAVLVSWNRKELLQAAITSLRNQNYPGLELIVVDNGSEDGTLQWLRTIDDIQVIENQENVGACRARNQGIKASRGKYVIFLDSDAEIYTQDSLYQLVSAMEQDSTIAASAGIIYKDNALQEVWCISPCTDWEGNYDPVRSTQLLENPPAVSTCFSVFQMDALKKAGGFDEYYFYLFEDGDLCEKLRKMGYRFLIERGVKVVHHYADPGRTQRDQVEFHYYHEKLRMYYVLKNWGLKRFLQSQWYKLSNIKLMRMQFNYLRWSDFLYVYLVKGLFFLIYFPFIRQRRDQSWI